jgi:trimethylamine--corrinoid protein Co-methyltransferase
MASAVSGSEEELVKKPLIDFLGCVGQPLTYESKLITGFMEAAKHKMPIYVQSGAMAGATGPATLAGTLALCNAEILSGIVIVQMTNPGTPVIYMNWARIFDMKAANVSFNSPEFVMLRIAVGQLVRRCYHIPFCSPGFQVDSKMLDVQAGYEKYVTLISMLSGANIMLGETVAGANYTDPLGWVIDDELAANYKQIMKGLSVNNETLALDVVRSVGTGPGRNFLGTKHTHRHFRENQWLDYAISDRRSDSIWEKDGAKDAKQRAREKLQQKLRTYQPEPLPLTVQQELDRIVNDAKKRHA